MNDHGAKSEISAPSLACTHSPFCDAKGPAVQEGFVAARIQEIHARRDEDQQQFSRSYTTSCHIPRSRQIQEYLAPYRIALASRPSTCVQGRTISNQPADLACYSCPSQSSFSFVTKTTNAVGIATRSPVLKDMGGTKEGLPYYKAEQDPRKRKGQRENVIRSWRGFPS